MKKTTHTSSKKQPLRYHAEADLAYLVKLNRIGHGWSTEELSFLIGRPLNYINTRENLKANSQFTVEDLVFMATAFDMSATEMVMHNPGEFRQFQFQATVEQKGNIIFHEIWRIDKQSQFMLCRLYEFPAKPDPEKEKIEMQAIIKIISRIIKTGFFKQPRHPLSIYRHCCKLYKKGLAPSIVKKVLAHFASGNLPAKLQLKKNKDESGKYALVTSSA